MVPSPYKSTNQSISGTPIYQLRLNDNHLNGNNTMDDRPSTGELEKIMRTITVHLLYLLFEFLKKLLVSSSKMSHKMSKKNSLN